MDWWRKLEGGKEALDRWLHRYAGQGERRDATRTFVATNERDAVRGYYTLVAVSAIRACASGHRVLSLPA